MIEVFKTDVQFAQQAEWLVGEIHQCFPNYKANFDLEDCDRILRIEHLHGAVDEVRVIELLRLAGFTAEVLADDFQPNINLSQNLSLR